MSRLKKNHALQMMAQNLIQILRGQLGERLWLWRLAAARDSRFAEREKEAAINGGDEGLFEREARIEAMPDGPKKEDEKKKLFQDSYDVFRNKIQTADNRDAAAKIQTADNRDAAAALDDLSKNAKEDLGAPKDASNEGERPKEDLVNERAVTTAEQEQLKEELANEQEQEQT